MGDVIEIKKAETDTNSGAVLSPLETLKALFAKYKNVSLTSLAKAGSDYKTIYAQIEKQLLEVGGELTEELEQEFYALRDEMQIVEQLTRGKVDSVSVYIKHVIPSQIEALNAQIELYEQQAERLKALAIYAVQLNGGEALNGQAWRVRTQKNAPSVIIDDAEAIPDFLKRATVSIGYKFDASQGELITKWSEIAKQIEGIINDKIDFSISIDPDKKQLSDVLKKDTEVPGCHLEQGVQVRFEAGKSEKTKKSKSAAQIGSLLGESNE
jgi:hypothetical protein